MDKRGGGINIFLRFFLSHSAEKFRRRIFLCCFRSFPLAKKFMDNRGGGGTRRKGVSRFSVENLSYSAEKFRRGTLLCCVSENFR